MSMIVRNSVLPRFFDEFLSKDFFPGFIDREQNVPAVNITESNNDFRIEVAAPGLERQDFKIDLENGVVTIWAEKQQQTEPSGDRYVRREFNYTSFKRSFSLPDVVDAEKVAATHKNGVLSVVLPKRDTAKVKPSRQITIE